MIDLPHLLERAARHDGVLHRRDLDELEVTRHQRQRLRVQGLLVPIGPNTFGVPGTAGPDQLTWAACLETDGAASHTSAARRHDLGRWGPGLRPEVIVERGSSPSRSLPFATVHTTTWLPADDVLFVDGLACTSVARTLLLLAAPAVGLDDGRVRDLVDEAIRDGKASEAWLWWRLERLRCRGRSGIRRLEAVLDLRAGGERTESWLERTFLDLVRSADLPLPEVQQRIDRSGAFVGRVDFAYPRQRLVVEVSGHEFHASREQLASDAARRNQLQLAGYRVLEFTYDQVVRTPELVIAVLRDALGRA